MNDQWIEEVSRTIPEKAFLSMNDVCELLACSPTVIYNWVKRADPKRRPPRIVIGREVRFPKGEFLRWLAEEQTTKG
jgi:predicted DNA-binding transcriptional regulator AlpA